MRNSTSEGGMAAVACDVCGVWVEFDAEDHPNEIPCTHCYNRIQVE